MRRCLVIVVVVAALGGSRPLVRQDVRALLPADGRRSPNSALKPPAVACPAPAAERGRGAARSRAAGGDGRPPPRRRFIDRLFVSGTLVAREEVMVAAQIDGLTIVEIDAEDGDVVKAGQVLARLDRTQLDALLVENDAATARADAAIEQAETLIAQAEAQLTGAADDYDRARKLGPGIMAASTVEQRETALKTAQRAARRRQERARGGRGRSP